MNTATFDTHQAVKAITNTGLKDTQAEAIVTTINNAMSQNLATKSDVVAVKADIATVRTELKADIATVTAELKADIATVTADLLVLKWMVGLIIIAEILPLLKLLFA